MLYEHAHRAPDVSVGGKGAHKLMVHGVSCDRTILIRVPLLSDEAIASRVALAEAKAERGRLERELKRVDKAFLDTDLAPCGHM